MTSGTLSFMWLTQPTVLKGKLFQDEGAPPQQFVSQTAKHHVTHGQWAELLQRG